MDIYAHAEIIDADYMDSNYNIYKVQAYNRAILLGLPTAGIEVYDCEGNFLGIALKK